MVLGDDAAPIFEPLKARLERFWGEEAPLDYSDKPREAALRREQNEQLSSALEILLRAHPEKFLGFYARLADNTPLQSERVAEMQAWPERNRAAWDATQKETSRLLEAEWGREWSDPQKRYKLPSRVLRELDERARAKPEVAALWAQLDENPWQSIAPEWNPVGLLLGTWNSYLIADKPTGPTQSVNARLRPVLWSWLEAALDLERDARERERMARRLMRGYVGYQLLGWLGREALIEKAPPLLLASKEPLLAFIQSLLQSDYSNNGWNSQKGDELTAALWLSLMTALGRTFDRPYNVKPGNWQLPAIELEILRDLLAELPKNGKSVHFLADLRIAAHNIEKARAAQSAPKTSAPATKTQERNLSASAHQTDRELLSEMLGYHARDQLYPSLQSVQAKIASFKAEAAQLKDEECITRLVKSAPHPNDPQRVLLRLPNWKIWSKAPDENGAAQLKAALWPRAEPLLWERFEEQLQTHRRLETEPIEPDIAQKLTEREAKEWRARMRREKREVIAKDILDIADLLIYVDGLPAHLKAIELADRPGCREIRDQLERKLFYQLEQLPRGYNVSSAPSAPLAAWGQWKLGAEWDAILAKMEARLAEAKEEWTRNVLGHELATGFYRRGSFAKFEHYATRPETFPQGVALATLAFDDFEAWRVLLGVVNSWNAQTLFPFWQAQQDDPARRARALEAVMQVVSSTSSERTSRALLKWLEPLAPAEFQPHLPELESALESAIVSVKKWAMKILGASDEADFDRERAAGAAGEALWSENLGLAKDAAKFLSTLALQDLSVAESVWAQLEDATGLENIGLCEAVLRALVRVQSKNKTLELGEAASEKLEALVAAQPERFGKFAGKLTG